MSRFYLGSRLPLNWWVIILVGWVALITFPDIRKQIDERADKSDWIVAHLDVVRDDQGGPPGIRYCARVTRSLTGNWTATIHRADGGRIATRKGRGDYTAGTCDPDDITRPPWFWQAFFESPVPAPVEPTEPYRVCVRYHVQAVRSGVAYSSPRFCSSLYDPALPVLD